MARCVFLLLVLCAGMCAGVYASDDPNVGVRTIKKGGYTFSGMDITFQNVTWARFSPFTNTSELTKGSSAGNVFRSGIQIGTYQRTYTIANPGQALGSPVTVITNIVIELGSTGNDAVVLNGALTLEEVTVPRVVYKSNVAITGGTGRYLGATGSAFFNTTTTARLRIYVPKL